MAVIHDRVLELVADLDRLKPALDEIEAEWRPDPAPLTSSMGSVGRVFAESSEDLSVAEIVTVFQRIEVILRDGTDHEKDAVATGFLEAMVAVLDRIPEHRWILRHAGNEARHYLAEWDRFCGASEPRKRE